MPRFITGARSKTHKGFTERWGDTPITTFAAATTFRDPNLVYVPYEPVREGLSFWHKSVIILVCIRHEDERVRKAFESRVQEDIMSYYGSLVPGMGKGTQNPTHQSSIAWTEVNQWRRWTTLGR